jgi:site-specific recombinase XerD
VCTATAISDDLVFTAPKGGVVCLRNWRPRVFDKATRAADLAPLSPQELRHTAASLAVAAGANVKAVQRMLGHASAAMTLDTYSGRFEDDLDAVADRLDEAASRALARAGADFMRTSGDLINLRPTSESPQPSKSGSTDASVGVMIVDG